MELPPLAGGLVAAMGYLLLPAIFVQLFDVPVGSDLRPSEMGPVIACQLPGCLFVLLIGLLWPMGLPWRGSLQVLRVVGLYCVFLALWYPFVIYGNPVLLDWLDLDFEPQAHLEFFIGDWFGVLPWIAVLTVGIFGPLAEEILFRGYLTSALLRFVGRHTTLILVSALFGLIHGLLYALPMFGMGLFLGYLRQSSGGLAAPILVHVLHNTHTVLVARAFPSLIE
ncbi:MAG: lysostaphin resistance A-like protein [Planctomycetota bacterium]|jgi:membrane protease YdiL (CAAX protease family)